MASNIGKLVAEVGLDTANMDKGLKGLKDKVKGVGAAFTAMGAEGALALKGFITSAQEQQIGVKQLTQTLKTVGVSYGRVTEQIEGTIDALQRKTNFGDEAQRDALRALVAIGGDYEAGLRALPAVLDLAADRNMDLSAAALLVGKALAGDL